MDPVSGKIPGVNPPDVPDHTMLRPIGRGAYGEVWLARNVMGTLRAVKIIWRKQFESDRPFEREFEGIRRYEPLSRSADGLVHVLQVGRNEAEGYFYYVMELADNGHAQAPGVGDKSEPRGESQADEANVSDYSPRTLRSELKRCGRLPVGQCLRLALDAAGGLAQLHRRGLVHRDVKPGNIIFVDGRAKLADIGLVSTDGEGGTFVGTEGYIPPEGPGTPGADLYALGIALYEASTGLPPERFPEAPAEWFAEDAAAESLEFHQILLKACEAQKERRYKDVETMQADLALLQSGQSVRRLRAMERRLARARRIGGVAAVVIAVAVTVAGLAKYREALMSRNLVEESRLRGLEQAALKRAETAESNTRQQLYTALLQQAHATVRSGELGQRVAALEAVKHAAGISNSAELRGVALAAMMLPDLRFERNLPTGPGVTVAQLDPAFERIALGRGTNAVELRAVSDNRLLAQFAPATNHPTFGAWWSADGRHLAVTRDAEASGRLAEVEVWEVAKSRSVLSLQDVSWGAVAFHPGGGFLASGHAEGSVSIWDLHDGREACHFALPATPLRLKYSPDGRRLAVVCEGQDTETTVVCNATNGSSEASHVFTRQTGRIDWNLQGTAVSIADAGGNVYLMDASSGETRTLGAHTAEAVTTAFSPDGHYLVSGGWEGELIFWDLQTMQRSFVVGLKSYLLQFRADGRECAVVTDDGVQLCAMEAPVARSLPGELGARVLRGAFSPDSRLFAASGDERMGVWDVAANRPPRLDDHTARGSLAFGTPADLFATDYGNEGYHWKVSTPAEVNTPPTLAQADMPSSNDVIAVCATKNAMIFTSSAGSGIVNADGGANAPVSWVRTFRGVNGASRDGRWLGIFTPFAIYLNIYSLPELRHTAAVKLEESVASFAFSPASDELAVASHHTLSFFRTSDWKLTRGGAHFSGILYCPDGDECWLERDSHSWGLHDLRTLEELVPLPAHAWPLAESPDGRWLALSVESRRLVLLDLAAMREEFRSLGVDWRAAAVGGR